MRETSPYETNEISAAELGGAIQRRWWLVLVGLVLGLGLSFAFSITQAPKYDSVTTALVHANAAQDTATDRLAAEELAKSRAVTYESLGNSVVVADTVKQELGLDTPTDLLLENVRVVARPDTTGLEITASAASPEEAAELASAWRDALAEAAGDPQPGDNIEVIPAGEPTIPENPSGIATPLIYAIGAAIGLLLGIIAAVSLGHPRHSPRRTD
ncbi:YveK family protein [Kocuria sp.]|uniref:YveK family protein n=1 Tax=Kocuria sp. TaxID=1871328 RepID=UPI0026E0D90D|nr:Wzz/FepE/Etk N-terminal domain-containing protein [Kocuria sp.]MDO5619201.1 Wzz/FepE/Etk N-terminal domain-containing protein [Kocuria sp.]